MSELWERSATELAACIARGECSSLEAVDAHLARIDAVDGMLRAVVVQRAEDARAEARACDRRRANGEPLGPLHGVPVSIKESLDVAGTPATYGLPSRACDAAPRDDPYVARWRAAGAVVIAKTNVPQLLIYIETDNPLYGRTNNPWNIARSCGGSSGGEGALVAAGGSPLGLGTDIGGSLRVPASFCGIASFKPTQGRLDDRSRLSIFAGQRAIVSQVGPLARTVADVDLGLSLASGDSTSHAMEIRGLRVGVFERAGKFRASPALERATREAAALLEARGAHVVPFEPPYVDPALDLFYGILSADGARGAAEMLGDDTRDPRVAELLAIATKPRPVVRALARLLALGGQRSLARIADNYGYSDTHHYWKLVEALESYRRLFGLAMDAADGGPLDLLVCPPVGLPAIPHGRSADVYTAGAYGPLFNVLGYPCGTLPFTSVRAGEEIGRRQSRDRVERGAYDAERDSAGLPAGVQLVARPGCDDIAFAAMYALEEDTRDGGDVPRTPVTPPYVP
jgi:fatty acid amide hydrolase